MLQSASSLGDGRREWLWLWHGDTAINPAQLFVAYCARTLCGVDLALRRAACCSSGIPKSTRRRRARQAVAARRANASPP